MYACSSNSSSFIRNVDIGSGPAESLQTKYRIGKTVGRGTFATVKMAEHIRTGHNVAIKAVSRQSMTSFGSTREKARREFDIWRLLAHPHVIRLYEVIETPDGIHAVMEHAPGGELFDYILQKGRVQEKEARRFFQQIIAGVDYCHRNMVVHRDIKPENLLLDLRGNLKISDFGFSNIMQDGHLLHTYCGSPNYIAPEILCQKTYSGPEADIWSCGVTLYTLLCGGFPFHDESVPNLLKKIKSGNYTFPRSLSLSPGARDLIQKMLIADPMKRITIREIRQHPWFSFDIPGYLAATPSNATDDVKKFDEEIIQEVLRMGFDRSHLIESLWNGIQNDATVTYYLFSDKRSSISIGCPGTEFQESTDSNFSYINGVTSANSHKAHV